MFNHNVAKMIVLVLLDLRTLFLDSKLYMHLKVQKSKVKGVLVGRELC